MTPTSSPSSPSSSNPLASSIPSTESITSASSATDNGTVATLQNMSTMSTFQSSRNSALLSEMEPNSTNHVTTPTTPHLSSLGSNKSSSSSSGTGSASFRGNVQNVHGNIRSTASKPSRSSRYLRKSSLGKKSSFTFGSSSKKTSFSSSFASNATNSSSAVNTSNTGKSSFASNFSSNFNIQNLFSKINEGLNKADEEKQQQERLDYDTFVGEGEGLQGYNGLSIMANEGNECNEQVAGFQIGTSGSHRDNDSKSVGAKKSFLNRIKPKRKNKLSLKALAKFKSFRNSNVEPEFEEGEGGSNNINLGLGMDSSQAGDATLFQSQLEPANHLDRDTPSSGPNPLHFKELLPITPSDRSGSEQITAALNPFDACCQSAAAKPKLRQNSQTSLSYSSSSTPDHSQTSLGNSRYSGSNHSSSSFNSGSNPYYNPNLIYSPTEPQTYKLKSVSKLREEQARQLEEAKRMLMIERKPVLRQHSQQRKEGALCWDLPSFDDQTRSTFQQPSSHALSDHSHNSLTHEPVDDTNIMPKSPSQTAEITEPSYVSDAQSTSGASAASDASSTTKKRQLNHTMSGRPSSSDLSEMSNHDGCYSEFDEFGGLDDDFFGFGSNANGRNSNGWTKEEAGNLVNFANEWIPTDGKRRRIFTDINV